MENTEEHSNQEQLHKITPITGLYENWFLDYASYVILDRAVPNLIDGLKPVQRRIMHSMKEMDDGRFNKVANIIGNTMKYHPHGDASIGDALVQLGQKNLLVDTQGNWGDPLTGDSAAAPRYIEARLSKFAGEVVFNPQTTVWQSSYDGRNQEPILLPVKFPLLLALGVEGIAVGLATKVFPHNFIELIDASIAVLNNQPYTLYPDFPTGGMADFSRYNEGLRGGKVRVRAKIIEIDKKTLAITEIPFGTTTGTLIDSIISANDKGKIKIKKIEDNTAKNLEIVLHLAPGISPDITIDALYAFTDCETSISPNSCIIINDRPHFLSVNEILRQSTLNTKALLGKEIEIKLAELAEKWHFSSLEKIFIQEKIYRDIEVAETEEQAVKIIDERLIPFKPSFKREIVEDDILKLMEIRIKRITKYDAKKADDLLKSIEDEIKENAHHLKHLNDFAIKYFENLKAKYGKGRERKTIIKQFDEINATAVALANVKLYVNKAEGFIGTSLKKDEFVCECSDIDDIIAFKADGTFQVCKVSEKTFVGKQIIHVAVFTKNDERTVYNIIYRDGVSGTSYIKRFSVLGVTRDKEYDLTKGSKGSAILYFTANPNGEAEVINIQLKPHSKLRKLVWDINFAEIDIKGRGSQGNIVTKYPVKKVQIKSKGVSTLSGRKIWFDDLLKRLNTDQRGQYLGEFDGDDKILVFYKDGSYELTNFDLANHYQDQIYTILKLNPSQVYAMVYVEGKSKKHFIKRFLIEDANLNKKVLLISDSEGSKLEFLSTREGYSLQVKVEKGKSKTPDVEIVNIDDFIEVKGLKAQGNRLSQHDVIAIETIEPIAEAQAIEQVESDIDFEITNPEDIQQDKQQLGLF